MQCDECHLETRKLSKLSCGLSLCDSCTKNHWEAQKTHKPAVLSPDKGFKQTTNLRDILHSGKSKVTPELTESLRKLPFSEVQEIILNAVAVLTAATSVYGDKWIAESLKQQHELAEQQKIIVAEWREKQRISEREKLSKSLRGTEKKHYQKTGVTIEEMVQEFAERLKGEFTK